MSKDNGGPAFPYFGYTGWSTSYGMTLRDYFAAKAMQGFVSRWHTYDAEFDAARAYAFADAMLKARQKARQE